MSRRLGDKKSYRLYEDFEAGPSVTNRTADLAAWASAPNGAWTVATRLSTQSPLLDAPAAITDHPGLVQLNFDNSTYTEYFLSVGRLAPLKDYKRIGVTYKPNFWSTSSPDGDGASLLLTAPVQNMWGGQQSIILTVGAWVDPTPGVGLTTYAAKGAVNGSGGTQWLDLLSPYYIDVADWVTLEMEVDYPNRCVNLFIDGTWAGQLSDSQGHYIPWTTLVLPVFAFWMSPHTIGARAVIIDEFAVAVSDYDSAVNVPEAPTKIQRTLLSGATRLDHYTT